MQREPSSSVARAQDEQGVVRDIDGRRNVWEDAAVGQAELQLAVRLPSDLIALFMHGSMMTTAEHGEVRQRRRSPLRPVAEVMALAEAHGAAREAAATVTMVECPPYRRRNRPCSSAHFDDAAVAGVAHDDAAGVARQAPG